jgi:crotonobetainyl-CoA:carnitine CoA-transferase CaiB-like acyl-CoA transferase
VAAARDEQFHGLFRAVGRPDMVTDPRFASIRGRARHFYEMMDALEQAKPPLTSGELLARLEAEDVPCAPVLSREEVPHHPQVQEAGILVELEHPRLGPMRQPRPPARFSATPADVGGPAPALGEHTDAVLGELGLAPREIRDLRARGVVA